MLIKLKLSGCLATWFPLYPFSCSSQRFLLSQVPIAVSAYHLLRSNRSSGLTQRSSDHWNITSEKPPPTFQDSTTWPYAERLLARVSLANHIVSIHRQLTVDVRGRYAELCFGVSLLPWQGFVAPSAITKGLKGFAR